MWHCILIFYCLCFYINELYNDFKVAINNIFQLHKAIFQYFIYINFNTFQKFDIFLIKINFIYKCWNSCFVDLVYEILYSVAIKYFTNIGNETIHTIHKQYILQKYNLEKQKSTCILLYSRSKSKSTICFKQKFHYCLCYKNCIKCYEIINNYCFRIIWKSFPFYQCMFSD